MVNSNEANAVTIGPLGEPDLVQVVAIDAAHEGRSRRAYIERRLQAALREPALHAQLAATDEYGLAGYILARVLEGEFGRDDTGLRLELVGVRADARGQRVGRQLFEALLSWAGRHGVRRLHTAACWRDTRMLHWMALMGFELAPMTFVERPIDGARAASEPDGVAPATTPEPGREINFAGRESNDFERLARGHADVRPMTPDDLREIARVDRAITGRDRSGYIASRLAETLSDSAIRVSLTARLDGAVVGYLMARADLGDFGRTEPVAVIDTLGVSPDRARRGVGRAMLAELFGELEALRIERVETIASFDEPALAGFFTRLGFRPSQQLAFVRHVG